MNDNKKILNFLNNKEHPEYSGSKKNWLPNLRQNKGRQSLHWGSLGQFLKDNKIDMIKIKDNIKYQFSDDINNSKEKAKKEGKKKKDKWGKWLDFELEAFIKLGQSSNETNNQHVFWIIRSMLDDGYIFQGKDTFLITSSKDGQNISLELPSCEELHLIKRRLLDANKCDNKSLNTDEIYNHYENNNEATINQEQRDKLDIKCDF